MKTLLLALALATLPASPNPISFSQVQTEFGGDNPIGFNEYYRNGAYVPSGNSTIPTSGAISLAVFRGVTKTGGTATVSLNKTGVYGSCFNNVASCTATTDVITATINGGVGPFTVSHVLYSGTTINAVNNTSLASAHSGSNPPGGVKTAVYRVAVTDTGNGNTVSYSPTYTVEVENLG